MGSRIKREAKELRVSERVDFKQYEGIISDCSWEVSPSSVSCERNSLVWAEQKPVPLTLAGHGARLENG